MTNQGLGQPLKGEEVDKSLPTKSTHKFPYSAHSIRISFPKPLIFSHMPIFLNTTYNCDVIFDITGSPRSVSMSSMTSTTGKFAHGIKIAVAFFASLTAFLAAR